MLTTLRLIAAYPTAKQNSTPVASTNAPGSPGPLPSLRASGTLPTMAASGAAAATTRKTIRAVDSFFVSARPLVAGGSAGALMVSLW